MGTVDFVSAWNNLWTPIRSAVGGQFITILAVIGVALIVLSLFQFFWQRRRGGGMNGLGSLTMPLILGALLVAPDVLVPTFLWCAQGVVNVFVALASTLTTG
ncbi:hypothetical protein [Pseudactinotalea sp. Z1748]|uniref:hypothetical protein n=1 Tax=Pseudactinotalea sp. Z1748 TaxID=3413027 RepID=UPI003C7A5F85